MDLKQFFQSKGYDISEKLAWNKYIEEWDSWYKGKVKKFHNYYIYNGNKRVKREKKSLQSAKKVCEDWADLLFNEKVRIALHNEEQTKDLIQILKDNKAQVKINRGIERTFALGTGAFVVSVDDMKLDETNNTIDVTNSKIKFQFVKADKIFPLSWEDDNITECAFVTYKTLKGIDYLFISMHILNEKGNYVIQNYKFKVQNKSIIVAPLSEDDGFVEEFDTKNNIKWFSIYTPNICNNIDSETPFGVSVYANSIDIIKEIDDAYNELGNEPVLGRRRTFVAEEMLTYDSGTEKMVFDPEDISVYRLPKGFDKDKMIQQDSSDLRTDKLIDDVNFQLNILSDNVGFGQNKYKFDGKNIQTATGVISENSHMFRRVKKHEQTLENCLVELITALAYASTTFSNYNINVDEIKIDFDDSIIEDKSAERVSAQAEVGAGLRSKQDYIENIRGFGEQEAKEELEAINNEKISNVETFGMIPTEE